MKKRFLIVAPHPDDAELGIGATIIKLKQKGHRVFMVDLTDGEPTPLGTKAQRGKETKTHQSWRHMIERCNNSNNKYYHCYGGRGIKVCKRWLKFENFLEDMGERPSKLQIDRINNDKDYYKTE